MKFKNRAISCDIARCIVRYRTIFSFYRAISCDKAVFAGRPQSSLIHIVRYRAISCDIVRYRAIQIEVCVGDNYSWSFQQKSHHAKFQLNLMRNGWVTDWLEILQRYREFCSATGRVTVLSLDLILSTYRVITPNFSSIQRERTKLVADNRQKILQRCMNTAVLQGLCFVCRFHPWHYNYHVYYFCQAQAKP